LHDDHNDYPLAPEHLTVTEDMLSPYALSFDGRLPRPTKKLVPNLMDKTKYVVHYRNLKFYVAHGLVVTKIHRVLAFRQEAWLKPYIDHCTMRRQAATDTFHQDLYKYAANACFGKSMESVRKRINVRLIADPHKATKAVSKPTLQECRIINEDLVMVRGERQRILLNKPISAGFAILELSKLLMYQFHYDYIKKTYGNRAKLLFTDTDSLTYHIKTDNLYDDMKNGLDWYDTSNFAPDHPLYSTVNKKVVGKFKSETGSKAPKEFVGLRAKMYSLLVSSDEKPKCALKGIGRAYVKKHVTHDRFVRALETKVDINPAVFRTFRSTNHTINTLEVKKACLSAWDDKRYILDDGVSSLAYGHRIFLNV
jgi:hypothetical protein